MGFIVINLSILICHLESRSIELSNLLAQLKDQIEDSNDIEILIETDKGESSIGAKRNKLLDRSVGKWICYVDDDDSIEPGYIQEIMDAIEIGPDAIGIKGNYYVNGELQGMFIHSHKYKRWEDTNKYTFIRSPNHLNPIKRELALKVRFPEISMGEDADYSARLLPYITTEVMINIPIYNYQKVS